MHSHVYSSAPAPVKDAFSSSSASRARQSKQQKQTKEDSKSSGVAAPSCGCHWAASGEMVCPSSAQPKRVRTQTVHDDLFPPTSFWNKHTNQAGRQGGARSRTIPPEKGESYDHDVPGADWHTYTLHPVTVSDPSEENTLRVNRTPFDKRQIAKKEASCGFCEDDDGDVDDDA